MTVQPPEIGEHKPHFAAVRNANLFTHCLITRSACGRGQLPALRLLIMTSDWTAYRRRFDLRTRPSCRLRGPPPSSGTLLCALRSSLHRVSLLAHRSIAIPSVWGLHLQVCAMHSPKDIPSIQTVNRQLLWAPLPLCTLKMSHLSLPLLHCQVLTVRHLDPLVPSMKICVCMFLL
jgi:hypothetical protein